MLYEFHGSNIFAVRSSLTGYRNISDQGVAVIFSKRLKLILQLTNMVLVLSIYIYFLANIFRWGGCAWYVKATQTIFPDDQAKSAFELE